MIGKLWAQATTPKIKYTQGRITTEKEANAAARVDSLRAEAKGIVDGMMKIDETEADANRNTPNSIYGQVPGRYGKGSCQVSDESVDLNYNNGALTYTKNGDREEFHTVHANEGSPSVFDLGPSTLYTEEWAIVDGPKVSYKKIEYWGN